MKTFNTALLFDHDCEFAAARLQDSGQLAPMFAIHFEHKGDLGMAVVLGDFRDQSHKERSVQIVKLVGVALDAFAISLMTEAWTAVIAKHTDPAIAALAPSERMDRREILMVVMSERDAKPRALVREILRGDDGGISGLGEAEPDHDGLEGRMTGLITPHRPTAQDRRTAQDLMAALGIRLDTLIRPS